MPNTSYHGILVTFESGHAQRCSRMCQDYSLRWLHEVALIVVREIVSPLPYELTLDAPAEIRRDSRDEHEIAGLVHGRIDGVAGTPSIARPQSLRGFADSDRATPSVGLDVNARYLSKLRPRVGEFLESMPLEFQ